MEDRKGRPGDTAGVMSLHIVDALVRFARMAVQIGVESGQAI
jgi:hypothetical protein